MCHPRRSTDGNPIVEGGIVLLGGSGRLRTGEGRALRRKRRQCCRGYRSWPLAVWVRTPQGRPVVVPAR